MGGLKEPPFFLYDEFVNKLIIFLLSVFLFGCSSTSDIPEYWYEYVEFTEDEYKDEDGNPLRLHKSEYPEYMANRSCTKYHPDEELDKCMERYIPIYTQQIEEHTAQQLKDRPRLLAEYEENKKKDSDDETTDTNEWTCIYLKAKYEGFKQTQKNYERRASSYYKQAQSLAMADRRNEANNATSNGNYATSKAKQAERDANRWKRRHNDKCSPKIW
tara:strand:- start:94 stop:741 length:648 start_codon:yes stop_codon:yes gene_type:complete